MGGIWKTFGGILEQESESLVRNHALRRHLGSIWEALGCIWEAYGGIWETFGKDLGGRHMEGIWETFGGILEQES